MVNRHGVRVLQQKITECLQQLQRYMVGVVLGDRLGKCTMVFFRVPSAVDRVLMPGCGTQGRYRRRMGLSIFLDRFPPTPPYDRDRHRYHHHPMVQKTPCRIRAPLLFCPREIELVPFATCGMYIAHGYRYPLKWGLFFFNIALARGLLPRLTLQRNSNTSLTGLVVPERLLAYLVCVPSKPVPTQQPFFVCPGRRPSFRQPERLFLARAAPLRSGGSR